MAKKQLVIGFNRSTDETFFKIEIDKKSANMTPTIGRSVFLRVITNLQYTLECTDGKVKKDATSLPGDAPTETHYFKRSMDAELSYPPDGLVEMEWLGRKPASTITVDNRKLTLSEPTLGILRANYGFKYDRWMLYDCKTPIPVLVIAVDPEGNVLGDITIDFTVGEEEEDPETICDGILIEKLTPDKLERGDTMTFQVVGMRPCSVSVCPGQSVNQTGIETKTVTEQVTFSNGKASVSKPIYSFKSITIHNVEQRLANSCEYEEGLTGLTKSEFIDQKQYSKLNASVTYSYVAYTYVTAIPAVYPSEEVIIDASFDGCEVVSLAIPFEDKSGLVDVTVHLKSACDGSAIEGAICRLYLESGTITTETDEEGRVTFTGLTPGDEIPIQWEATGYKNSWEDELCNDILVVPNG